MHPQPHPPQAPFPYCLLPGRLWHDHQFFQQHHTFGIPLSPKSPLLSYQASARSALRVSVDSPFAELDRFGSGPYPAFASSIRAPPPYPHQPNDISPHSQSKSWTNQTTSQSTIAEPILQLLQNFPPATIFDSSSHILTLRHSLYSPPQHTMATTATPEGKFALVPLPYQLCCGGGSSHLPPLCGLPAFVHRATACVTACSDAVPDPTRPWFADLRSRPPLQCSGRNALPAPMPRRTTST